MASKNQVQVFNYLFNAATKTITFLDYDTIALESILLIRNQTTGDYIFKATDTAAFGGAVATNVLTFTAANAGMADTDSLLIFIGQEGLFEVKEPTDYTTQKFNEYADSYTDERGNLLTRAQVSNLEDSFTTGQYADELGFSSFTNNSKIVTLTSPLSDWPQIRKGSYIVLASTYFKIVKILSNTTIELDSVWTGATNFYAYNIYPAKIFTTLAFGSSYFNTDKITFSFITSTNGAKTGWVRSVGFGQKILESKIALNTRDNNSIVVFGFNRYPEGNLSGANSIKNTYCQFLFDGTVNTIIKTQTSSRVSNQEAPVNESYTIALPNGWTTAQELFYRIEILDTEVNFYVSKEDDVNEEYYLVAKHKKIIPDRYLELSAFGLVYNNTGLASNIAIDFSRLKYNSYNTIATSVNAKKDSILAIPSESTEVLTVPMVANAAVIIDMSQYSSIAIQFTGVWSGTWDFQASNDPLNWFAARVNNLQLNTIVTTTTANGVFTLSTRCKYVRLFCSNSISGTAIIRITRKANPVAESLSNVTLVGTNAVTATISGTPSVTPSPVATAGASTHHRRLSTASTNLVSVKTSATAINDIEIFNVGAAICFVKLYNKNSAPVIASDAALIIKTIAVPAGGSAIISGAFSIRFAAGLAYSIVAGIADTDATAINADEVIVNVSYT